MNKRTHYNYSSKVLYREFDSKQKKTNAPAEYWKQRAAEDAQDAPRRQECEVCHTKYEPEHMRYVILGSFKSGYVCKWCQKIHQYQEA